MSWECEDFTNQFIEQVEPILYKLGAQRFKARDGVIGYEFLYKFPNNVWFSCDYDLRDNYFECSLGCLFRLRDCLPRVVVLEHYKWYIESGIANGLLLNKFFNVINIQKFSSSIEGIAKTLEIILMQYETLYKGIAEKIADEKSRLKSRLIKNISKRKYKKYCYTFEEFCSFKTSEKNYLYEKLNRHKNIAGKIELIPNKNTIIIKFNKYLEISCEGRTIHQKGNWSAQGNRSIDDMIKRIYPIADGNIIFIENTKQLGDINLISRDEYEKKKREYLSNEYLCIYTANEIIKETKHFRRNLY